MSFLERFKGRTQKVSKTGILDIIKNKEHIQLQSNISLASRNNMSKLQRLYLSTCTTEDGTPGRTETFQIPPKQNLNWPQPSQNTDTKSYSQQPRSNYIEDPYTPIVVIRKTEKFNILKEITQQLEEMQLKNQYMKGSGTLKNFNERHPDQSNSSDSYFNQFQQQKKLENNNQMEVHSPTLVRSQIIQQQQPQIQSLRQSPNYLAQRFSENKGINNKQFQTSRSLRQYAMKIIQN